MAELRLPSINYVILSGRLTHDPELRYTPTGRPVLNMQLASNRRYLVGDEWKDDTLFIRVTVWGPNAERMGGKLVKGSAVVVEGRLAYRQWESEGQKRSIIEIQAIRVQSLDKAAADSTETEVPATPDVMPDFDEGIPEEELPF
ncbi:MAG: single-stranded DNA-binding protein [candidate division WOR-3 bacterium]